ncbi:hypothetical protein F511_42208 [Dorcoceras hygrometricum]|uniref:Dystroglycan-like n=1 Tax=Dorcoceras hygrometricum TaxID=472368 RepID=A0A2Z7BFE2_9LAMI|nr:hypothetical protein F511_42208 [Dorcoceras hygrometricum]
MASSLISNNHHIDFDAVFGMKDTDLVQMFESLIATGLKNFLGCPTVFNEDALTDFFANNSVREDGLVVSTVNGVSVEISEEVFAATFELPVEGLTDLSEVPKNLVFDARCLFSISNEKVSISCLKKAMKIQYRLLHDILAKTIYVKAGSFDSVTRDRFMLMTAITFDVKINGSSLLFGVLREMVTPGSWQVKGYAIQICVLLRNVPGLELGESKTFPIHRVLNEKIVHRYVVINDKLGGEEVVDAPKVKRTPAKKKGVTKKRPAAGDAEVAPIVKKKSITKGKPVVAKRLPVEEPVGVSTTSKQPVVEVATGEREPVGGLRIASITEATTGDADAAIEQFLAQLDLVIQDSDVERSDRIETWFDRAFDEEFATADQENQDSEDEIYFDVDNQELLVFDETRTVPEAGGSKNFGVDKAGEKPIGSKHTTEEHMSIDDLLMQISEDMMLPSVTAAEITKVRLGESINIHEVQEHDLYYASLPRISIHDKGKEKLEEDEPGLPIEQPCTSTFLDTSVGSGAVLAQFYSMAKSTCWVRPLVLIDGVWTPIQGNDFLRSSCKLSLFVNRKKLPKSMVEEDFVPHCYLIEPVQYLGAAPSLIKTWGWARVCTEIIRYSIFGCLRLVCREIVVYNLGVERIPDYLLSDFQKGVCTETFVGFFSGSSVQTDSEIELSSSDGDTVYRSPSPILQEIDSFEENLQFDLGPVVSTNALEEQLYYVESPESPPPIPQRQVSFSSSSDSQINFDTTDIPLDDTAEAQTSLPAATADLSPLLDDLKTSLSQCVDTAHSDILSRLRTGARQQGKNNDDLQILRLNELKKNVMTQGVTTDTASLEIRKAINAVNAKVILLDGQVAAITCEHLELQAKLSADLLSLSTQIGDLVDYICSDDAKKGEGSSSRRPLPTPVHHSEGSGDAVRLTEPTQAYIDNANRAILERMRNEDSLRAERERDMARRERRLSRSGAYKRRRGY